MDNKDLPINMNDIKLIWNCVCDEDQKTEILNNRNLRLWLNRSQVAETSDIAIQELHINGVDYKMLDPAKGITRIHVGVRYNIPEIDAAEKERTYGVSLADPSAVLLYVFKVANDQVCGDVSTAQPRHTYYAIAIDEVRPAFLGWATSLPGGLSDGGDLKRTAIDEFLEEAIPGFDLSKAELIDLNTHNYYTPGQTERLKLFAIEHEVTKEEFAEIGARWHGYTHKKDNEATRVQIMEIGDLYLAAKGPTTAIPLMGLVWYGDHCAIKGNMEPHQANMKALLDPERRQTAEGKFHFRLG